MPLFGYDIFAALHLIYNKCAVYVYSYSAWASALLVSTLRAMREPQFVGRVTGTIPTSFFFICNQLLLGNWRGTQKLY